MMPHTRQLCCSKAVIKVLISSISLSPKSDVRLSLLSCETMIFTFSYHYSVKLNSPNSFLLSNCILMVYALASINQAFIESWRNSPPQEFQLIYTDLHVKERNLVLKAQESSNLKIHHLTNEHTNFVRKFYFTLTRIVGI